MFNFQMCLEKYITQATTKIVATKSRINKRLYEGTKFTIYIKY